MIINLLSSPRNVSTALMYSFAQRPDTKVVDEPFYAYYLDHIEDNKHPGHHEIIESMSTNFNEVLQEILEMKDDVVFLKNMTHHFFNTSVDFMKDFQNIIFIRDPDRIINSFAKVIPNPQMSDVGIQMQLEVFNGLTALGSNPIIVDSRILLQNPKAFLRKLCSTLDIPFFEEMLSWKVGPRPEDGIWAKYWYKNVHNSTGFSSTSSEPIQLTGSSKELSDKARPYYLELSKHAIQID